MVPAPPWKSGASSAASAAPRRGALAPAAYRMVYTNGIYQRKDMPKTGIAKLFRNGRSQAVRLPREFRLEGDQVRVRRVSQGVLLEPLISNPRQWFAALDRLNGKSFVTKARNHPLAPHRDLSKQCTCSIPTP